MIHPRNASLILILVMVLAGPATGQAPVQLFTETMPPVSGEGPPAVLSSTAVVLNMADLKWIPESLSIDLEPGLTIVATLHHSELLSGFDEFGAPLPGVPDDQLRYVWHGKTPQGGDVILSVFEGILKGRILGPEAGHFVIVRSLGGDRLLEIDVAQLPPEENNDTGTPLIGTTAAEESTVAEKMTAPDCTTLETVEDRGSLPMASVPQGVPIIEILTVFTERARRDALGDPLDPSDDENIINLIVASAAETNVILENSEIDVRVAIVHIARYEGYQPTGSQREDLFTLVEDPCIQALRNQARADLVSVVVRNSTPNGLVPVCGQAVVQRPGCRDPTEDSTVLVGCDPGLAYRDFAYHFVAIDCMTFDFTPAHEICHCLACEHLWDPLILDRDMAFSPESFAHLILAVTLDIMARTLMSTDRAYVRAGNISNPDVSLYFSPYSTGEEGLSNNAQTVRTTAEWVQHYGDLVFGDDFESGTTSRWSLTEGAVNP